MEQHLAVLLVVGVVDRAECSHQLEVGTLIQFKLSQRVHNAALDAHSLHFDGIDAQPGSHNQMIDAIFIGS